MIDQARRETRKISFKMLVIFGRDWLLTMIMIPFFLLGLIVGLIFVSIKFLLASVVIGYRRALRLLPKDTAENEAD